MRTVVIPPPGVHGFGRMRTVGVVGHKLTRTEAVAICRRLDGAGIGVLPTIGAGGIVHLRPERRLTTAEEVTVLRAFAAVSDSRLAWHPAVKS